MGLVTTHSPMNQSDEWWSSKDNVWNWYWTMIFYLLSLQIVIENEKNMFVQYWSLFIDNDNIEKS